MKGRKEVNIIRSSRMGEGRNIGMRSQNVDEVEEFAPQITGKTPPNNCPRRKIKNCEIVDIDSVPIAVNIRTATRTYKIDAL